MQLFPVIVVNILSLLLNLMRDSVVVNVPCVKISAGGVIKTLWLLIDVVTGYIIADCFSYDSHLIYEIKSNYYFSEYRNCWTCD